MISRRSLFGSVGAFFGLGSTIAEATADVKVLKNEIAELQVMVLALRASMEQPMRIHVVLNGPELARTVLDEPFHGNLC